MSKFTSAGHLWRYKLFSAAQNGMVIGIFQHFQLALQAVALPLPSRVYDCCAHTQHVRLLEGECVLIEMGPILEGGKLLEGPTCIRRNTVYMW